MTHPRITVVTPSFNQAPFLERTLRSVLEQDYPNLQFGVVDGGSTDGSVEILRRYQAHLDFLIIEPDRGQSQAINKGLRRADGAILAWLNSDDTLLPGTLRRVGAWFQQQAHEHWLIGQCRHIDAQDQPLDLNQPVGDFTLAGALLRPRGFNVPQPATFWRKEVTERCGLLDEQLHHCMDFELWCRFLLHGYRPVLLAEELATYRLHESSKSCAQAERFIAALIEIEARYLPHLPPSEQARLRRNMGYQTRALALRQCHNQPWKLLLQHPWWIGSAQVRAALWRELTTTLRSPVPERPAA